MHTQKRNKETELLVQKILPALCTSILPNILLRSLYVCLVAKGVVMFVEGLEQKDMPWRTKREVLNVDTLDRMTSSPTISPSKI